jgi:hypothetical protein
MRILAFTVAAVVLGSGPAVADDCAKFTWDVAHELAVMKQVPQALTAAVKNADVPVLQTEHLYEVKLAPQGTVSYLLPPDKPARDDNAHGGLVHFRVPGTAVYRVSLSSGHWIDVVAGGQFVKSRDFQGHHGCDRPHKIVEFELSADSLLTLQFSGAAASPVLVAITAVAAPVPH